MNDLRAGVGGRRNRRRENQDPSVTGSGVFSMIAIGRAGSGRFSAVSLVAAQLAARQRQISVLGGCTCVVILGSPRM